MADAGQEDPTAKGQPGQESTAEGGTSSASRDPLLAEFQGLRGDFVQRSDEFLRRAKRSSWNNAAAPNITLALLVLIVGQQFALNSRIGDSTTQIVAALNNVAQRAAFQQAAPGLASVDPPFPLAFVRVGSRLTAFRVLPTTSIAVRFDLGDSESAEELGGILCRQFGGVLAPNLEALYSQAGVPVPKPGWVDWVCTMPYAGPRPDDVLTDLGRKYTPSDPTPAGSLKMGTWQELVIELETNRSLYEPG